VLRGAAAGHIKENSPGVAFPASFPLSPEGFDVMSTSVSQRQSHEHRPTRAKGPSIHPALISYESCQEDTHTASQRIGKPLKKARLKAKGTDTMAGPLKSLAQPLVTTGGGGALPLPM